MDSCHYSHLSCRWLITFNSVVGLCKVKLISAYTYIKQFIKGTSMGKVLGDSTVKPIHSLQLATCIKRSNISVFVNLLYYIYNSETIMRDHMTLRVYFPRYTFYASPCPGLSRHSCHVRK